MPVSYTHLLAEKCVFTSDGNAGGFYCTVMERAFYQKWIFKSFSVLVWCDGTELAEYKVCFWHSGIQLYLEKSGI